MPLASPTMPDDVFAVLQPKLYRWAANPDGAPKIVRPVIARGRAAPVEVAGALPTFSLSPGALSEADPFASVKQSGWRCPITSEGVPALWIDFSESIGRAVPALTAISQTPFHDNLVAAQKLAQANAQVSAGKYSAALLETPALYQIALWLRDGEAKADLLIPIASQYAVLEVGAVYPMADYLAALKGLLEERTLGRRPVGVVTCP